MPKTYVTAQGDTYDVIALHTLGDEAYAGDIIRANPEYAETSIFSANVKLKIPPLPEQSLSRNLPPWRS